MLRGSELLPTKAPSMTMFVIIADPSSMAMLVASKNHDDRESLWIAALSFSKSGYTDLFERTPIGYMGLVLVKVATSALP